MLYLSSFFEVISIALVGGFAFIAAYAYVVRVSEPAR